MADVQSLTPWILGLLAMAVGWLFKTVIEQGKAQVRIETAFKYYVESKAQGAAKVLDSPNPTPPEMRRLLKLYYEGKATEEERKELRGWLRELVDNPKSPKSERSAALDILTAMGTMKLLTRHAQRSH